MKETGWQREAGWEGIVYVYVQHMKVGPCVCVCEQSRAEQWQAVGGQ